MARGKRRSRLWLWLGIPLLLLTGCCGVHCLQGPVWGRVELADGAELDDVVLHLRCQSHAFHGSYTADQEFRVVGAGDRFLFPWMLGGMGPTGCTLNVYHPLYRFQFVQSEPDLGHGTPPLRLETWQELLDRAEAGEDVSPFSEADLHRHVFHMHLYYLKALGSDAKRRKAARYVPTLHHIYERGLEHLPPMEAERFGSNDSSLERLRAIEQAVAYQRPPEQEALFAAAAAGNVSAAAALLDAGADPAAWNAEGSAAIHLAAEEGHSELLIALLEGGANVDRMREGRGNTPLLDAILHRRIETALALIDRGADVTLGARGRAPLSASVSSGLDARVFYALAEHGAISGARDRWHVINALHTASRNGRVDLVRALIERGVPPDASRGTAGFTALMVAALDGQPDTARLLIQAGADVNARSEDGRTPLSMARQRDPAPRRRGEVIALLAAAGARE